MGNLISGNKQNGIYVTDKAKDFITFNTFGGLYAFGGGAPNGLNGMQVDSTGGNIIIRTNVFSGNNGNGLHLTGNFFGCIVSLVICGLNTEGQKTMPNQGHGLLIDGTSNSNIIGNNSDSIMARNTFSGNKGYGIKISENAYNNHVILGYVGLELSGISNSVGNESGGILLDGKSHLNTIGHINSNKKQTNFISDNQGIGIQLTKDTYSNQIINNVIGYAIDKSAAPNTVNKIENDSKNIQYIYDNKINPQKMTE